MTRAEPTLVRWQAAWAEALGHWSKYTRLHDPLLCQTKVEAAGAGLSASFAMIRLADKSVVIDLAAVHELGLDDFPVEILAHEIGHHVLAPATAIDHFRLLARIRRGLPTLETHAPMIANLYTDLLINDRLQRQAGLRMGGIYAAIHEHRRDAAKPGGLWPLYMGTYEALWELDRGSLGGPTDDDRCMGDAWLGARLVRVYASDWLTGGSRFAALVLPYLLNDAEGAAMAAVLHDTQIAGQGSEPVAISQVNPGELRDAIHPSMDGAITGDEGGDKGAGRGEPVVTDPQDGCNSGQRREPFEYGDIVRAAGVTLSDAEIAIRYYREQALPHLIRFPTNVQSRSTEPQLEGLEPWDLGDPLDEIDWLQSLTQSPCPIPGVTTVRRLYGDEPGSERHVEPLDLDIYVDCSGSMPNPRQRISFLALAGAIIALSALKVGARVQATLWSGKDQCMGTTGFVGSDKEVLEILTGYFGGGTAFPIHRLRDTYAYRPAEARAVHILMISDDGISTMFDQDERGNSGWDIAAAAMVVAGGGGTMALGGMRAGSDAYPWKVRAEKEQGWVIEAVSDFAELIGFAQRFSRRHYGAPHLRAAA